MNFADLNDDQKKRLIAEILCLDIDESIWDEPLGPSEARGIPPYLKNQIMGTVRLTQRQTNPEAAPNKLKEQVHAVLYKGLNKYSYLLQIYCDIAEVLGREVRRDFLGLHLPHRDDLAEVMAEYDIPLYMIQDAAMIGARRYPPMELVAYGVIDSPEDTDKSEEHVAYLYGIDCALVYMSREDLIVPMEKYQELVPDAPVLPDHLADRYRRR